ncbi:MAG: hypothetical protein JXQ71_02735 [Verrucomicrobia bacterium]|nr:hypothetical protein [Verrucomicrobiota bacterium]
MAATPNLVERGLNRAQLTGLRLLLAGAFGVSVYLAWAALSSQSVAGCGPESGCDKVLQSRWSSWLGIPVSLPGLGVYMAALGATGLLRAGGGARRRRLGWSVLVFCAVAVLGAVLWLVVLQVAVIRAICPFCMLAHGLGTAGAVLILWGAPYAEPRDKPWKVEKLVFIRPRTAWRLAGVAGVAVAVLAAGQVAHRPRTFAVSALRVAMPPDSPSLPPAAAPAGPGPSSPPVSPAGQGSSPGRVDAVVAPGIRAPSDTPSAVRATNGGLGGPDRSTNAVGGARRVLVLYGGAFELDLEDVPLLGSADAPVVAVALHDYTCHHCRIMHAHLAQARREFSNRLSIVNLLMPLDPKCNKLVRRAHPDHVNACEYARLGLAVWRAKGAAMEAFDDWVFTRERLPPPWEARRFAEQLVGSNALQRALQDAWVDRQLQVGIRIYATNYLHYRQGSMPQVILGSNVVVGTLGSARDLYPLVARQPGMSPAP